MSSIKLDLNKFTHEYSDGDSTTLRHQYLGHTITLAHNKLSKENKEVLKSLAAKAQKKQAKSKTMLAEGGEVEASDAPPQDAQSPQAKPWGDMSQDEKLQLLALEPETVQRAMQMAVGSIGPEMGAEGEMTQLPAEGMGKPARGVGKGVIIKDNLPKPNPNVTAVIDGKPVVAPQVPAFADGGDVESPVDVNSLYSTDPVEAAPVLKQRYQEGTENAIKDRAQYLQDMDYGASQTPFSMHQPQSPAEIELQAAKDVDTSQSEAEQARQEQAQKQQAVQQQLMAQKAKMGLSQEGPAPAPVQDYQQTSAQPPQSQGQQALAHAEQGGQGGGGLPDQGSLISQAYNMGNRGIEEQAKAQAALGQAEAGVLEKQQENDTAIQGHYQQQLQQLESERQAHIQDIQNGYVNPDRYWTGYTLPNGEKVDGHSKVASAIGMIIAGFNPTSRPNAATELLQKQMDQSLEAQKTNLQSSHNLLRANLDQFRNVKDATDMTRIMMNDAMQHKLELEAAKAKTPMAQAALYQAKAKLAQDIAPLAMQLQIRRTIGSLGNDPNRPPGSLSQAVAQVRMINPEMGKDLQERLVPNADGQGREALASIPVPAAVRSEMLAKQNLNQAATQLRQWAAQNSGTLSPSKIAEGRTLAANVQNLYREGINGGVFKKGEQEFIDNIVDSHPDKFFASIRTLPKLDAVLKSNEASLNTLKQGYGLPVVRSAASQTPVKGKDGKMYIFDPRSKHYIPVK